MIFFFFNIFVGIYTYILYTNKKHLYLLIVLLIYNIVQLCNFNTIK